MAAQTVQSIVDRFRKQYPGCNETDAVALLNEVIEVVLTNVPLARTFYNYPLVVGQTFYNLDETILKVWSGVLYTDVSSYQWLEETTEDQLDANLSPVWRQASVGTPTGLITSNDLVGGQFGVTPPSQDATLNITGATNANPIVITVDADHNLTTGDLVNIQDVLGNTAANNDPGPDQSWSVTVLTDTTFSIDATGSGAYTSGGTVLCSGSPRLTLYVTQRVVVTIGGHMPATPQIRTLWMNGMKYYYAQDLDPDKIATWKALFDNDLADQNQLTMKRPGTVSPVISLVRQRQGWRSGAGMWGSWGSNNDDFNANTPTV